MKNAPKRLCCLKDWVERVRKFQRESGLQCPDFLCVTKLTLYADWCGQWTTHSLLCFQAVANASGVMHPPSPGDDVVTDAPVPAKKKDPTSQKKCASTPTTQTPGGQAGPSRSHHRRPTPLLPPKVRKVVAALKEAAAKKNTLFDIDDDDAYEAAPRAKPPQPAPEKCTPRYSTKTVPVTPADGGVTRQKRKVSSPPAPVVRIQYMDFEDDEFNEAFDDITLLSSGTDISNADDRKNRGKQAMSDTPSHSHTSEKHAGCSGNADRDGHGKSLGLNHLHLIYFSTSKSIKLETVDTEMNVRDVNLEFNLFPVTK